MSERHATLQPSNLQNRFVAFLLRAGGILELFHYRAYALWGRLAGRIATPGSVATIELTDGDRFEVLLGDFYWNRMLSPRYVYEPEIAEVLHLLRGTNYALLDCGANFGYWSVLVSGPTFGARPVVAIEANPTTHARLRRNLDLNGRAVTALHRAISGKSGDTVTLYERGSHAGASLSENWVGNARPISATAQVETIAIDDASQALAGQPLIVKLDVEGMEIAAMQGASKVLADGALIIYEDSGEDRESTVSAYVLNELRLSLYGVEEKTGRVVAVTSVAQVNGMKPSRQRGYNFLATRQGSRFDQELRAVAGRTTG